MHLNLSLIAFSDFYLDTNDFFNKLKVIVVKIHCWHTEKTETYVKLRDKCSFSFNYSILLCETHLSGVFHTPKENSLASILSVLVKVNYGISFILNS